VSVKRTNLSHSRQWFNTLIHMVAGGRSLHCRTIWSRLTAPVELPTRYTTPDTTVEIGSTSATVEYSKLGTTTIGDNIVCLLHYCKTLLVSYLTSRNRKKTGVVKSLMLYKRCNL